RRALAEFRIDGVPTTIPFHQRVVSHPVFVAGEATTAFLPEHPEVLPPPADPVTAPPRTAESTVREVTAEVNGRRPNGRLHGTPKVSQTDSAGVPRHAPRLRTEKRVSPRVGADGAELTSPLQGTVLRVEVKPGTAVSQGDLICVVEAMKMENEIAAHRS